MALNTRWTNYQNNTLQHVEQVETITLHEIMKFF